MSLEGAGEFLDLELGKIAPEVGMESDEITPFRCLDDCTAGLDGELIGAEGVSDDCLADELRTARLEQNDIL